jgi:diguanylate cyclase (GGDEF)-like protein
VLWFIVCVAVLNIAAGFGLGVYLAGYFAGGGSVPLERPTDDMLGDSSSDDFASNLGAVPGVAVDAGTPEVAADDATDEPQPPHDSADSADSIEDSVMADLDAAVSLALGDVSLPESEDTASPQAPEEVDSDREANGLAAFHAQLDGFCEELIDLDEQLRAETVENGAELKSHVDSVAASGKSQDEVCQQAEQSLRTMITSEAIAEEQGEAMIAAIQKNRQGTAEAVEAFEQLDLDADPAVQQEMVLNRTASLLGTNHSLRDGVSDLISATQSADGSDGSGEGIDPLTGIMSREALDTTLAEHWRKDPHHVRTLSFAVVDVDHFAKFNRNHGAAIGNRVLRALAELFDGEQPKGCHVARFSGQQFALLAIDRDLKQAVSDAERMRQMVETMRLEHGEDDFEITVSCGVVEATPDDTQETLYGRAIESIQEAKRYGRNRSFVHEGEFPTPVVPPNFVLNETHVQL